MHPVKRLVLAATCAAVALLPRAVPATLVTQTLDGWGGTLNLLDSRLTVHVADQWIDVEEEAELQSVASWRGGEGPWIAMGAITVPRGTAITGCMLWNGDTLLMGKLRGKAQANKIFDSLVPPVTTRWPVDPLLIEQISENVYNVKLFPLPDGGSRRMRIRYLVPRSAGAAEISIVPLLRQIDGSLPSQFRIRLRGEVSGLRLATSEGIWPVDLPFSDLVATGTGARLLWNGGASGALRSKVDSGLWAGDYVLYSGAVPDSVIRGAAVRSETVVLWSWIHPGEFFTSYMDYWNSSVVSRYLSSYGTEVLAQASLIDRIALRAGADGGRMGLVADLGMGDTALRWPLADTSALSFKAMRRWLNGLDATSLGTMIPAQEGSSTGTGDVSGKEIAELRQRFRADVREVGAMYSPDSGVIRHLVVVTAGISASTTSLERMDPALLPERVSVQSTRLYSSGYSSTYKDGYWQYVQNAADESTWPGVDLGAFADEHSGTAGLVDWSNGILLPKIRSLSAARLTIGSASGAIRRNVVLARDAAGRLRANLNVRAPSLEKSVKWDVFDDSGRTLRSWIDAPTWVDVGSDSILPRLWAKSETPIAPSLEGRDLGPIYGVVDLFHSLLATPSDTVGAVRQLALRDSGVPFLAWTDIFPRQGYGAEAQTNGTEEGSAVQGRADHGILRMSWLSATRTLRIDLQGVVASGIEIRDLRGRLVASISAGQLAGLSIFDWKAPAGLARGLLVVTVRTGAGIKSGRIMVH